MLRTKMNKAIIKHEKERKAKLLNKIKFELEMEEEIKQNRLWFKRK